MSDKFIQQQRVEREQLRRLLATMKPLLDRCRTETPSEIELSALAACLHSLYTGIENIFKRATVELDGRPVTGENWHRELLNQMARPGESRGPVISGECRTRLAEYLAFRHVFRNAYSFDLHWNKMRHLVLGAEEILAEVEAELDRFLAKNPE